MNLISRLGPQSLLLFIGSMAVFRADLALAAQVSGVIDAPYAAHLAHLVYVADTGYVKIRVGMPARNAGNRRVDVALFLQVKESLPIPESQAPPYQVSIYAYKFVPAVAACVVDGKVRYTNEQTGPVTLMIDNKIIAELKPGESKIYACAAAEKSLLTVSIRQWPWTWMNAYLFVGDVGVIARPSVGGSFSLEAPKGKYELHVIGPFVGSLFSQELELDKTDVDLGHINLERWGDPTPPELDSKVVVKAPIKDKLIKPVKATKPGPRPLPLAPESAADKRSEN